jgi:Tfp pilus assembly protein PilO
MISPRRIRFDIRQTGKQVMLALLALLVANLVFGVLLVRPRIRAFDTLTEDSLPRRQEFQRRTKEVEAQEKYLAALEQSTKDLATLRNDVLSTRQKRMIEVQYELARLARQFNINMERVQYENEVLEDESLERMAMVVPLAGGYSSLRKFVQAIEQSDRFLVLERVALEQGQEGGVMLQRNLTLATYFDSPEMRAIDDAKRPPKTRRT